MSAPFEKNCPVIEKTADGVHVGRCWFYMKDGKTCPRHGDVSEIIREKLESEQKGQPAVGSTD